MTAPTRTAGGAARNGQSERERSEERTRSRADPRARTRSAAAERAYARKQERGQRSAGSVIDRRIRQGGQEATSGRRRPQATLPSRPARQLQRPLVTAKRLQEKVTTSRGPFVITVMAVLAAGIVGTLWLSIAAVSNSFELRAAEAKVNALSERKETLLGQVSRMNSTSALQQHAEQLGLVPGPDPAHLVVHQDGSVTVVGEPKVARAPRPPAPKPAPAPQPERAAGPEKPPKPDQSPASEPEAPGPDAPPPAGQTQPDGDPATVRAAGRP